MTDDELKTRLRHSADVLRDMLYDDLAEGCSRTVQRIDELRADLEAAKWDVELMRDALERIVRTPAMPFPDPEAHSWDAYHRAVHRAWAVCHNIALAAIERAAGGEG